MRSASTWKNKEKKHLHRRIIPACHGYGLLDRNPSRVSVSTSPGVSQIKKLAIVGYPHSSQWMTKIQAQTCASQPRRAAYSKGHCAPYIPPVIGAAVLSSDLRVWGWREELISATPSEMLLSIYIHEEKNPRVSIQLGKSPVTITHFPLLLCNQTSMNSNSIEILIFLTSTSALTALCSLLPDTSLWRQRPGTHSGVSNYWLPSHQPSENAATQMLTLHSAYITFAASLSASTLKLSLTSPSRLCSGVFVVTSPSPASQSLHPWLLQPCSALSPPPCPGSAFPCHPHNTQDIDGTREPSSW